MASDLTILNLRDGGAIHLIFPKEINTDDRTNYKDADVANIVKPLFFANIEPQKVTIDNLTIDNTRTNESVEPVIETLRSWMRTKNNEPAPPPLQILTGGFQQKVVLSGLQVRREFFTTDGICIRAYLTLTFDEIESTGLQIEATPKRRSRNSLSGRTLEDR